MSKRNLTTSILGDAGATEATVAPNYETLNTGQDSYVTTISDTSEFNVYNQLRIYDNFWDTQFSEHIVNASNSGGTITNAIIQGNTEGWVRCDHMCLVVPFEVKYSARNVINQVPTDTNVPGASYYSVNHHKSSLSRYFNLDRIRVAYHPRYAFLDCFNRLKVLLGNNGQQIQKTAETQPLGLKHHMVNHRYGAEIKSVMSCWGLRNAHTRLVNKNWEAFNSTGDTREPTVFDRDDTWNDWMRTWSQDDESESYFKFLTEGLSNKYGNLAATVENQTITPIRGGIQQRVANNITVIRQLVLPLQCVIPFFRGAKYLPPDFRFKFELESSLEKWIAQSSRIYEDGGIIPIHWKETGVVDGATQWGVNLGAIGIAGANANQPRFPITSFRSAEIGRWSYRLKPNAGDNVGERYVQMPMYPQAYNKDFYITAQMRLADVKFAYPWHILRQPVQAAISTMWLQKPFLFNYESTELLENVLTNGQQTVNIQVAISAQRPTLLQAYLVPVASKNFGARTFVQADISGVNQGRSVYTNEAGADITSVGFISYGGFGSVNPEVEEVMIGDSPTNAQEMYSPMALPAQWVDLEIRFSGRTGYRFRNDYTLPNQFGQINTQSQNFMCNLWNEQSYRSYGTEFTTQIRSAKDSEKGNLFHWNSANSQELINLVIQPGGWTDRGIISSRQGATTIQLVITFSTPLSSNTKLCVFRTNPEQLVFDSDKNVTIIQWPAVKNNAGYLIPNVTAAP